jgi:serine/threonine-protein kinase SRPK3
MARMLLPGFAGTYSAPLSTIKFPRLARLTYASSDHKHVTLKIGTPEALEGELRVLRFLRTIKTSHSGSLLVRQMLDDFQVDSKNGVFQCVVHPPLAISIKAFRRMLPDRALPVSLVKQVLKHLLLGLDFLHTEAKVIHTGESSRIQRS